MFINLNPRAINESISMQMRRKAGIRSPGKPIADRKLYESRSNSGPANFTTTIAALSRTLIFFKGRPMIRATAKKVSSERIIRERKRIFPVCENRQFPSNIVDRNQSPPALINLSASDSAELASLKRRVLTESRGSRRGIIVK